MLLQRCHHIFLPILYIPMIYTYGYLMTCNSVGLYLFPTEKCWSIPESDLSVIGIILALFMGALDSVL